LGRGEGAVHGEGGRSSKSQIVKGLAHITGGGFVDNIPRVLPKNCDVIIRKGSWDILTIFQIIAAKGHVPQAELYEVFNMGIGMTLIVSGDQADAVLKFIRAQGQTAWLIGEVIHGKGHARII
jgi:phosphoribosylformylglycinamidine cyclo-ligase